MNEFKDLVTSDQKEANVFICGIPNDKNSLNRKGAAYFPRTLRSASYLVPARDLVGNSLKQIKIYDCGDYAYEDLNKLTNELQFNFLTKNGFHIIVGGDHSVSIPSERAFYCKCLKLNKQPVIIHLGAHLDMMQAVENNQFSNFSVLCRASEYGYNDKNICMIGPRVFNEEEMDYLSKHKSIDVFKSLDLRKLGVSGLAEYLVNKYADNRYLVYISFNLDVLDPSYAPSVQNPVSFGLTNYEVSGILGALVAGLNVDTIDIVEGTPNYDPNGVTTNLTLKIIYEMFSSLISSETVK
jgi:arginase family enzyme